MKIFSNDDINKIIDVTDTNAYSDHEECNYIVREVYDNEYYVACLVILGSKKSQSVKIDYSIDSLANNLNKDSLPSDVEIVSVINRDIETSDGYREYRDVMVSSDSLSPVYVGIDASYLGDKSNIALTLTTDDDTKTINIELVKNGHMLHNKGADDASSMSRLMWLNSKLFNNNRKSYIYDDIKVDGDTLKLYGKDVLLSKDGYISNVLSYFDDNNNLTDKVQKELLDGGIRLEVSDNVVYDHYNIERVGANLNIHAIGQGDNVTVTNNCTVKYEGAFYYNVEVVAKNDTIVDIAEINAFSQEASRYMNGLGHTGGLFETFNFKWNNNYQDSLFVGDINIGANIRWIAEDYSMPLNKRGYKYKELVLPTNTWDNEKKGGIDVLFERERARVSAYTGKIRLARGERRVFRYVVHLTPFHEIDMAKRFEHKYYENNRAYNLSEKKLINTVEKRELNSIVLHTNSEVYPYINAPNMMGERLLEMAKINKHIALTLNYNVRDISINSTDILPMRYLGDILFSSHEAEISKSNNIEEYRAKIGKDGLVSKRRENDISTVIAPLSRYNNYYVEMVNWLAKECNVKGVMMKDALIDRNTVARVRKALDRYHGVLGTTITNTANPKMGNASSMNNNIEILPFMDTIVTGKGYNSKNMSPDELLMKLSGIPYGICADGIDVDPFLGMLYGVVARNGMNATSNKKLHKLLFEKFDIKNSKMVGYWSDDALHAKDEGVKITYYVSGKKALICMYNFNNYPAVFNVDYSPLKINGVMKSYPMSRLIINQKFMTNTTVVIYNKCGLFMLADLD